MPPKRLSPGIWFVVAAALLALPAAWPLLQPGFIATRAGGDSPFLLQRLHGLLTGLSLGFPVRWMPDSAFGLGYPFWNFYAPLPYYLAALFSGLGLGILAPLKLAQLLGFVVAAVAMYALAAELWGSRWSGLWASVAYTYAPFHLVNVYVRGDSLGEFWAFAFYPLTWLAARHVVRRPSPARIAALALTYAGLVLSHNISALIFSPFLALYGLLEMGDWRREMRDWRLEINRNSQSPIVNLQSLIPNLQSLISSLLLGLGLSAWFWGPALAERDAVRVEVNLTGFFSYTGHFRGLDLVQPSLLFNYDPTDGAAFALGLVQALVIGLGVVFALRTWRRGLRGALLATFITLGASLFLITPLSQPLWDRLPLLPFTQFPWRLLSIVSFAGALLVGRLEIGDWRVETRDWRLEINPNPRSPISSLQSLISNLQSLIPSLLSLLLIVAGLARLDLTRITVADSEVTARRIGLYEVFSGNIGTTIRAEYLPSAVEPRPMIGPALLAPNGQVAPVMTQGEATAVQVDAIATVWTVDVASPQAQVAFPTFAFPGWSARVNGQPVEAKAATGLGYLSATVPAGRHTVTLHLGRSPVRALTEGISMVALVIVAVLLTLDRRWLRGTPYALVLLALTWLVGLALRPAPVPSTPLNTLSADFVRLPWLHRNPGGVVFESGARLLGYTVNDVVGETAQIEAGAPLSVALHWAEATPGQVDVVLVSPAEHLYGLSYQVANERLPIAPVRRHTLAVPAETTPGLYWLRLRVQDGRNEEVAPLDDEGRPLGRLYLIPVYVTPPASPVPPSATPPVTPMAEGISLLDVQTEQRTRRILTVLLTWHADRPPVDNYVVSLRVVRPDGSLAASTDRQPGYGFFPTSAWTPGQPVQDRRQLGLPGELPAGAYRLDIVLYQRVTGRELGRSSVESVQLDAVPP